MGQKKGQTGNPKGRPKGTPNRVTSDHQSWIKTLIDGKRRQFTTDLNKLEPKDRLVILERLMQYVIPKQQSVSIEEQLKFEYEALERLLESAPDEALDQIIEKIKQLKDEQTN